MQINIRSRFGSLVISNSFSPGRRNEGGDLNIWKIRYTKRKAERMAKKRVGFGTVILTRVQVISRYHFKCENVQREIRSQAPISDLPSPAMSLEITLISQHQTPRPKMDIDQLHESRAFVFLITYQITILLQLLLYKLNSSSPRREIWVLTSGGVNMAFDGSIDNLIEELVAAVAEPPPKARTYKQSLVLRSVALNRERFRISSERKY